MTNRKHLAPIAIIAALIVAIGAAFYIPTRSYKPLAAPAELGGGYMTGADCQARLDAGTAGLSAQAVAWLNACIEALGAASPSPSPTGSPSPTVSPSPTASATPTSTPTPSLTTSSPSPTPTPTPSPTSLLTDCFDRLAECGYPTPQSTGVPAFAPMSAYTGPMTITTAGTVIDGKAIGCGLTIKASNVVIRNSKITGPCFYGVDMEGGSLLIEDSEVDCVDHKGTGIAYTNFTARRVLVRNCENGFHVGSNTLIEDSYITGVVEVNGGHGDGVQGQSGSNITIRHTVFDLANPITSSVIWDRLTMTNVLVENNFFAAGAYTVYVPTGGTNIVYRNNRFFGPVAHADTVDHRPAYGFCTGANRAGVTWVGNYRDDTGASVPAA